MMTFPPHVGQSKANLNCFVCTIRKQPPTTAHKIINKEDILGSKFFSTQTCFLELGASSQRTEGTQTTNWHNHSDRNSNGTHLQPHSIQSRYYLRATNTFISNWTHARQPRSEKRVFRTAVPKSLSKLGHELARAFSAGGLPRD